MDSPYEIRLRDLNGGVGRLRDQRMVNAFKHWRELIDFRKCPLKAFKFPEHYQADANRAYEFINTSMFLSKALRKHQIDGRILFLVITLPRDRTKAGIAPT